MGKVYALLGAISTGAATGDGGHAGVGGEGGAQAGARDPDRLTHEIALLMDGAIVTAMIAKAPTAADFAQAAMQKLVEAQTV